jgi:hypothetical protein
MLLGQIAQALALLENHHNRGVGRDGRPVPRKQRSNKRPNARAPPSGPSHTPPPVFLLAASNTLYVAFGDYDIDMYRRQRG